MRLLFRPLPDPSVFHTHPGDRLPIPFSASYADTERRLNDELQHLGATDAWLQVLVDGPGMIRKDGMLYARAQVLHPGVVLTIVTPAHGTLVYVCDRFAGRYSNDPPDWQANLRAITLGLHDLRRLERYGIADRGQQYAGFRELGTGTSMGDGGAGTLTREDAARYLGSAAGWDDPPDPDDEEQVERAYRQAAKAHHPDVGGNPQMMVYLNTARAFLLP